LIPGMTVTTSTGGITIPNNTTIVSITNNAAVLSNNVTGNGQATITAIGPSDGAAEDGGIIVKGTTDKSIKWKGTDGGVTYNTWVSSENFDLAANKKLTLNSICVLDPVGQVIGPANGTGTDDVNLSGGDTPYALGSAVTGSSLTSVGSLNTLDVTGSISCGQSIGINGSGGTAYPLHVYSGQKYLVGLKNSSANSGIGYPWLVHDSRDGQASLVIHFNGIGDRFVIKENGVIEPNSDNSQDLGSTTKRWANVYSADVHLNNTGTGGNEVDGSEGHWTMQEGADDLFLINRITGKKYKFNLTEV